MNSIERLEYLRENPIFWSRLGSPAASDTPEEWAKDIERHRAMAEKGIKVHILNMGLIENTLTGNLILTVMLAFAEYERGTIVERTQTGKMVARQNPNFKDGRPKKYTPIQIEHALSLLSSGKSYKEVEEITGISKSTMIREKNKKSIFL